MNTIKREYTIYIKSHVVGVGDYENTVMAESKNDAVEKFYEILQGEFDRQFISSSIMLN